MSRLENKVAVITGGSSGIGLATAKEFIAKGAYVVITGRTKSTLLEAEQSIGHPNLLTLQSDTSKITDLETLYQTVGEKFGKIDTLFVNAGVGKLAPFEHITEDQFDQSMDINFKGAFFAVQKALPYLNEGASVILLSSVNAHAAMPNTSVYGPSKAAMNSLGKIIAAELAPRGIRVNIVSPGPIQTPFFGKVGLPQEAVQQFAGVLIKKIPLQRFGQAEEVAKAVVYLASDDSQFITGAELLVDGGINLHTVV